MFFKTRRFRHVCGLFLFSAALVACGDDSSVIVPTIDGGTGEPVAESCEPNPCVFGECFESEEGAFCACDFGWGGTNCSTPLEVEDFCAAADCGSGECVNEAEGFRCECDYGFGGDACFERIDVEDFCVDSPCANGTCINENDGATCRCNFGWGGSLCDEQVDHCDPNPCVNGTCSNTRDGAVCTCERGWGGPFCNGRLSDSACEDHGCVNGTCRATLRGAVCDCDSGWGGELCDMEGADACATNPCINGDCSQDGDGFSCDCWQGYEGDTCASQIPGAEVVPILEINDCRVPLYSVNPWVDNGDGTYTTSNRILLEHDGRSFELPSNEMIYDSNMRAFRGGLTRFPRGPIQGFDTELNSPSPAEINSLIQTGAELRERFGDDAEVPIPDDLEVLAMTLSVRGFTLDAPWLDQTLRAEEPLGIDETNLVGVFWDPCDITGFFTLAPEIFVGFPVQVGGMGGSLGRGFELTAENSLWEGEFDDENEPVLSDPPTRRGGFYASGSVDLTFAKIPIAVTASLLVDDDPDDNGALREQDLRTMLRGGFPEDPIPEAVDDFSILAQGVVEPGFTLAGPAAEVASTLGDYLGIDDLEFNMGEAILLIENTDENGFGTFFRGTTVIDAFEGTPIETLFPTRGQELMGYVTSPIDFGIYFRTRSGSPLIPGSGDISRSLVVRDGRPEIRMRTALDLGVVNLPDFVPVDDVDLGEVGIEFEVNFTTGQFCGEVGYDESTLFTCTFEVCVSDDGIEVTPECLLPRFTPCGDDSVCASGSCSQLIPDSACIDACDAVRSGCEPTCEATKDACETACDIGTDACRSACHVGGAATCAAGCALSGAACTGCDTSHTVCNTGCDTGAATCEGRCGVERASCSLTNCAPLEAGCIATCIGETGVCGGACAFEDAQCRLNNCVADAGGCVATCAAEVASCAGSCALSAGCLAAQTSCEAGCELCRTFPELCPEGIGACFNSCSETFSECTGACAANCPSESACVESCTSCNEECSQRSDRCFTDCDGECETSCYPSECEADCSAAETVCTSACERTRSNCATVCDRNRTSCRASNCSGGNACLSSCTTCEDECPDAIECYRDTCGPECGASCDVQRDLCLIGCDGVMACD